MYYTYNLLQQTDLFYDPVTSWTASLNVIANLIKYRIPAGYNGLYLNGGEGSNAYYVSEKERQKTFISDKGTTGIDRLFFSPDYTLSRRNYDLILSSDDTGLEEVYLTAGRYCGVNFDGSMVQNGLRVFGSALTDRIVGTNYNDYLDGGGGINFMFGGKGDDVYRVNNRLGKITERYGEGKDKVEANCSWGLGDYFEDLELVGTGELNGRGNELNNTIIGNNEANVINGWVGADTMIGKKGNDTYYVDDDNDVVIEQPGEGVDTVYTYSPSVYKIPDNVENCVLFGRWNKTVIGNNLDNVISDSDGPSVSTLYGGAGNDRLIGGRYQDTLIGGSGADVFEFGSGDALIGPCYDNFERILDFEVGTDIIDVPGNTLRPINLAWSQKNTDPRDFGSAFFDAEFYRKGGLTPGGACAVQFNTNSFVRTFIVIDATNNGFDGADNVVEITGFTGNLFNVTVI